MNIDTRIQFGLLIATVAGIFFTVGYNLSDERAKQLDERAKVLEARLAQTEDFRRADIPRMTAGLTSVLSKMEDRMSLAEKAEQAEEKLEEASKRSEELHAEIQALGEKVDQLNSSNTQMRATIDAWSADSVEVIITGRDSKLVGKERVPIGVSSVGAGYAEVTIAGKPFRVTPGTVIPIGNFGEGMEVIVGKVDYRGDGTVAFTLLRRNKG